MQGLRSTHAPAGAVELACPQCRRDIPPVVEWGATGYACERCGATYRVVGGVPRFVTSDDYAHTFTFEWLRHRQTQLDAGADGISERTFRQKTGLVPEDVAGRLVLDAGCGMGRFAEVVSRWGGTCVGVDLSRAVEAAAENIGTRPNVFLAQADLRRLPFRENMFDIIYSIGVLHHTPDCASSFRALLPYLAPGGTIVVWVYAQDDSLWMRTADLYRRATVRMPPRLLYSLSHLAVPMYYAYRIPIVGRGLRAVLPLNARPQAAWRILDTFDWYSPRYQSKHTYPEVYRWFHDAGLERIRLLDESVAVSGVKPSRG
jgi:SAM-dependent methyltransferase